MKPILALLLGLAAAGPAAAQHRTLTSVFSAEVTGEGLGTEVTMNSAFHRVTDFAPEAVEMLVQVEAIHRVEAGDGGFHGEVRARGFGMAADGLTRPLWSTRVEGQRAELVRHAYLRVTRLGCCAKDDTYTLLDATSGQVLLPAYAGEAIFALDSTGAEERVAGLQAPESYDVPEALEMDADFRGILRLAHPDGSRDAAVIRLRDPGAAVRGVARCDASAGVMLGEYGRGDPFHLCLQVSTGGWIQIPVEGTRLALDAAALPSGATLERLP